MDNKTVLITGMHGFIGRHLAAALREAFHGVRVEGVDRAGRHESPDCRGLDLLEPECAVRVIGGVRPDYIFHLAGVVYSKDLRELYRGNVETTVNILDAVKKAGLPARVVVAGSAAEYGDVSSEDLPISEKLVPNPASPYGVSKVWQTTVARYYAQTGVDTVVGRLFNVIGQGAPEGLSIGAFAGQLKKIRRGDLPPELSVGNLKPRRDFIDVVDACRGLAAIAEKGRSGEIYNICSGSSVSMESVLGMMIEASGLEVRVAIDPARFKGADAGDVRGSSAKISSETGWQPSVPLLSSIAAMVGGF
ncbi:MAG: NAD-dependent epimerase/dehydratase family protein [Deltaproteobacteria bacterium]|nr:NAD-dependent epimerase/dehydratase family protein [Deltaproteobacteria bacterium]